MTQLWMNNRLRLAITPQCNIACAYCHNEGQPKGGDHLDNELFESVLGLLRRNRQPLDALTFTGGEPLLHPELERFVSACRPLAQRLTLVTNGLLLTRNRIVALKQAGIGKIRIGLDSICNSRSRPTPSIAPPTSVLQAIEVLMEQAVPFELNTVVTRFNQHELPNILRFCRDKHISAKFFEHVSVTRASNVDSPELVTRAHMNFAGFREAARLAYGVAEFAECPDYGPANHVYYGDGFVIRYCRFLCPYGLCWKTGTRIDAKGFVYGCMSAHGVHQIKPWQNADEMASVVRLASNSGCERPTLVTT